MHDGTGDDTIIAVAPVNDVVTIDVSGYVTGDIITLTATLDADNSITVTKTYTVV